MKLIHDLYINIFIFLFFFELAYDYKHLLDKANKHNKNNFLVRLNLDNLKNNLENNMLLFILKKFFTFSLDKFLNNIYQYFILKIILDIIYLQVFIKFLKRKFFGLIFILFSVFKLIIFINLNKKSLDEFNLSNNKNKTIPPYIIKLIIYSLLCIFSFIQLFTYCHRNNNKLELTFKDLDEIDINEN
jgi:hypothetical protein